MINCLENTPDLASVTIVEQAVRNAGTTYRTAVHCPKCGTDVSLYFNDPEMSGHILVLKCDPSHGVCLRCQYTLNALDIKNTILRDGIWYEFIL